MGLTRPHVVAHSLGAAIALEIASREPGRVRALSLFAPAGLGDSINREFIDAFPRLSDAGTAAETLALLVARPAMISAQMIDDVLVASGAPRRSSGSDEGRRSRVSGRETALPLRRAGSRRSAFPWKSSGAARTAFFRHGERRRRRSPCTSCPERGISLTWNCRSGSIGCSSLQRAAARTLTAD